MTLSSPALLKLLVQKVNVQRKVRNFCTMTFAIHEHPSKCVLFIKPHVLYENQSPRHYQMRFRTQIECNWSMALWNLNSGLIVFDWHLWLDWSAFARAALHMKMKHLLQYNLQQSSREGAEITTILSKRTFCFIFVFNMWVGKQILIHT